jgi:hypothetical protein
MSILYSRFANSASENCIFEALQVLFLAFSKQTLGKDFRIFKAAETLREAARVAPQRCPPGGQK